MSKNAPHFTEGEKAVLAAMIITNDCIPTVTEILLAADFYHEAHRELFSVIQELAKTGSPVDYVTLTRKLQDEQKLDRIGGVSFLTDLVDAIPSCANVNHYATIVKEKAIRRTLIAKMGALFELCHSETSLEEIRDQFQATAFEDLKTSTVRRLRPISAGISEAYQQIETAGKWGLPTGFTGLDKLLRGLKPATLVVVGGRPSMGKSAFAADLISAAISRTAVAFFTIEMSETEVIHRFFAKKSGVNLHNVGSGFMSDRDWSAITDAVGSISEWPLFLDDSAPLTVSRIKSRVREISVKSGLTIGLLVIDYLQLMQAEGTFRTRNEEIAAITRGLKILAKDLKTPVVCLSQLNRKLEERPIKGFGRRPQLADFRDSGSIEQDADVVMGLYRHEVYDVAPEHTGKAEVIVLKQRNGPRGIVPLWWQPTIATFRDPAPKAIVEDSPDYMDRV